MTQPVITLPADGAYCPTSAVEHLIAVTLGTLGGTADQVADNLRTLGLKGVQKDECNCPVARLLLRLPEVVQVAVIDDHVLVWTRFHDEVYIALPEPVAAFQALFDTDGPYLDLVELPAVTS